MNTFELYCLTCGRVIVQGWACHGQRFSTVHPSVLDPTWTPPVFAPTSFDRRFLRSLLIAWEFEVPV